jgi:hypothetical protein
LEKSKKNRKIGLGEPGQQALLREGSEENKGVEILSLA